MTKPITVLAVDDNQDCLQLTSRMLSAHGMEVLSATSGREALEFLKTEEPDILLMDLTMPEMSGFEALQAIRQSAKHYGLPVIMLTASGSDEDVMSAYQYGSDYYITKPFTSEQLRYGIDLVLGRAPAAAPAEA